jgi:hypothetical protein
MARDNARVIEQLKTSQKQMVRDSAKAIEQLKTGQEQILPSNSRRARNKWSATMRSSSTNSKKKWAASLPRLPSRTRGPKVQYLRHVQLPAQRVLAGKTSPTTVRASPTGQIAACRLRLARVDRGVWPAPPIKLLLVSLFGDSLTR